MDLSKSTDKSVREQLLLAAKSWAGQLDRLIQLNRPTERSEVGGGAEVFSRP
jgi:hypothetical protein